VPDVDWTLIRTEYATTGQPLAKLAEKHGVSLDSIKKRSAKEGWAKDKKSYRTQVARKAIQKRACKAASTCVKQLTRVASAADTLTALVEKVTRDEQQFNRYLITTKEGEGVGDGCWSESQSVSEEIFEKYDMKAFKDFTSGVKDLVGIIRDVYGLPTAPQAAAMTIAKERLQIEKQRADAEGSGGIDGVEVSFEGGDAEEWSG